MSTFSELYREIFENNNLTKFISDDNIRKFEALTSEMLRVNEFMNLTAIKDTADIIAKHYADSLVIADMISENAYVIDVGTGAGFPTLPLAIVRPDISITALDSTAKKLNYISDTAKLLKLDNISILHSRAEEAGQSEYRESFDFVCARAVASLNVLCEYCLPFIKIGGKCLAMKSLSADTELDNSLTAIEKLGGEMTGNIPLNLYTPNGTQKRNVIIIQKKRSTPKIYPRNNAQINKNPL
jgi:16S rRNA (guanine(527)-N(7))-methyltransferase GidB